MTRFLALFLLAACGSSAPPEAQTVTEDEERLAHRIADEVYERLERQGLLAEARARAASSADEAEAVSEELLAAARVEEAPAEVSARHILIQFDGSARSPTGITRTRAEARGLAEEIQRRAAAGEDFERLAREHSDGPTAPRGGDLGSFPRGRMVEPFDEAVFALGVGEVSSVVETAFGFHVIQRYR